MSKPKKTTALLANIYLLYWYCTTVYLAQAFIFSSSLNCPADGGRFTCNWACALLLHTFSWVLQFRPTILLAKHENIAVQSFLRTKLCINAWQLSSNFGGGGVVKNLCFSCFSYQQYVVFCVIFEVMQKPSLHRTIIISVYPAKTTTKYLLLSMNFDDALERRNIIHLLGLPESEDALTMAVIDVPKIMRPTKANIEFKFGAIFLLLLARGATDVVLILKLLCFWTSCPTGFCCFLEWIAHRKSPHTSLVCCRCQIMIRILLLSQISAFERISSTDVTDLKRERKYLGEFRVP